MSEEILQLSGQCFGSFVNRLHILLNHLLSKEEADERDLLCKMLLNGFDFLFFGYWSLSEPEELTALVGGRRIISVNKPLSPLGPERG